LCFLRENEGFLKPYENDARRTKKRHKKVWVCVVDKMAPEIDFKTVIFEAPTQSESVFLLKEYESFRENAFCDSLCVFLTVLYFSNPSNMRY